MIDNVTNDNLKELLLKKKLTPELLMEIKTSFFIHPSKPAGDGKYQFTYSQDDDGENLHLYTSHEEYLKCHAEDNEVEPGFVYFNDLYDALYTEMNGIIINPSTDNFRIPVWLAYHIIEDIEENNETYENPYRPTYVFNDNNLLHKYCEGKKTFKQYPNLFSYLDASTLYTIICSDNNLDVYFNNGELKYEGMDVSFFKINSHYVLYSDMELLKDDIENQEGYCYYIVADAVQIVKKVLEFDYDGIILKTPNGEFKLPRKPLLKHYEMIIRKYINRQKQHNRAFKLGGLDSCSN